MGKKTNNGYTVSDMDKYQPTSWGNQANDDNAPYDYTTSSGQTCLIKRLGMMDILSMGLLDTLDFFSKSLSEDDKTKASVSETDGTFLKLLTQNFDKMEVTINKVLLAGVVAPVVHDIPEIGRQRDENKVYVDQIPFQDRVELFSEILDSEGLSSFREKSEAGVGHVPDGEVVQTSAE